MKKILLILILFSAFALSAQSDSVVSKYEFGLTGIYNSVNGVSRTTLTMNANNSIKWKKFESAVSTDYQLVSDDNINSVNDFTVRLQPKIVDENYSIFSFGQLSSLESKKISQRFEGGLGGGRNFFKKDQFKINLSYALLFYNNNFQDLTNRNGLRHSPRVVVSGDLKKQNLSYYFETYYQPSTSDLTDYILRAKFITGFKINDKFSITLNYTTWFESYYVLGARNDVKTLTIGTNFKI
jgi:hypothetical protein